MNVWRHRARTVDVVLAKQTRKPCFVCTPWLSAVFLQRQTSVQFDRRRTNSVPDQRKSEQASTARRLRHLTDQFNRKRGRTFVGRDRKEPLNIHCSTLDVAKTNEACRTVDLTVQWNAPEPTTVDVKCATKRSTSNRQPKQSTQQDRSACQSQSDNGRVLRAGTVVVPLPKRSQARLRNNPWLSVVLTVVAPCE